MCTLSYVKSSMLSGERNQIRGQIQAANGDAARFIYGKWNEGLYCGDATKSSSKGSKSGGSSKGGGGAGASSKLLWRPGVIPSDHELYYGFSQYAIELNELEESLVDVLPPSDSRFRPDQRWV